MNHPATTSQSPRSESPASSRGLESDVIVVGDPSLLPHSGRLAIVIDDLGNDSRAAARLCALPAPLTGAILPGLANSAETARRLEGAGKEVLLHLPMEPLDPRAKPGPGAIGVAMKPEEIISRVEADLADVPGAVGVNNHMGSRATADEPTMQAVMAVLARKGLYFLDSRTSEATVAEPAARKLGVPFLSRRIFLDDVETEPAIRTELARAEAAARDEGGAVAIGHPHALTLAVLEDELPRLSARGVTLVKVSELLRPRASPRP